MDKYISAIVFYLFLYSHDVSKKESRSRNHPYQSRCYLRDGRCHEDHGSIYNDRYGRWCSSSDRSHILASRCMVMVGDYRWTGRWSLIDRWSLRTCRISTYHHHHVRRVCFYGIQYADRDGHGNLCDDCSRTRIYGTWYVECEGIAL